MPTRRRALNRRNANAVIAAAIAPGPEILIVGHGPERPNTYHYDGFFTNANNPYLFPLHSGSYLPSYGSPYEGYVPGAVPVAWTAFRARACLRMGTDTSQARALCYAQVASSASRSSSLTYVTECPPVLQPSRRLR